MNETCDLCGLPLGDEAVREGGDHFCCTGCLEVHRTVDKSDLGPADQERQSAELDEDLERVYYRVPQMRCTSCESFLTNQATQIDGVNQAHANYASEMVMVDYDPDVLSGDDIAQSLNTGVYTPTQPTEGQDERIQQVGRLLVGGFFGMMAMVWYLLFIYPRYLGYPTSGLLLDLTGDAGQYLYFNLLVMSGVVVFYTGWPILQGAWVGLRSAYPNMDVLIALAVLNAFFYSALVLFQGGQEIYFDISIVVVMVVSLGRYFESYLKQTALNKVLDLSTESFDTIRLVNGGDTAEADPESITTGDQVLVKAGEEIPVDGTIRDGSGHLDESLVTGESQPVKKSRGDTVLAGSVLHDGSVTIEVTGDPDETFIDLMRQRMWDIQSSQFNYQRIVDKLAAIFVPVVLLLAIATFLVTFLGGRPFHHALLQAMTLLIVSCPCALGLATPMATMTAFDTLLGLGVAPRTHQAFDQTGDYETIVFDKTGTITNDEMTVSTELASREGIKQAVAVETKANHPLARSIESLTSTSNEVRDFREHSGEGVVGTVDERQVLVGNTDLFDRYDFSIPAELLNNYHQANHRGAIPVLVGWEQQARDLLVLDEEPRSELNSVLDYCKAQGLSVVVMTGDDRAGIESLIDHPGLTEIYRNLKPEAKVKLVRTLKKEGPTVMVGDGKNDAPALSEADLGIAVGNRTALASNAADLVFMDKTLEPLTETLTVIRKIDRRIKQNLGWAFLYNAVAIPAAMFGYLNPLIAAVAMSASSLMVVLNSLRSL
ncbi:MAG: heavy metal translocating P-type ATPase [bacterium]